MKNSHLKKKYLHIFSHFFFLQLIACKIKWKQIGQTDRIISSMPILFKKVEKIFIFKVIYRGGSTKVGALSLASILPRTNEYIAYEVRNEH